MTVLDALPTSFVGHPFAAIGKGEEMRANMRAYQSLDEPIEAFDVYRYEPRTDVEHIKLMQTIEARRLGKGIRIFHINGDEVDPVIKHLNAQGDDFSEGYNVIVPAWELPKYPDKWVKDLERFNEVWAISTFVQDGLTASGIESFYVGQSIDIEIRPFVSRRYFGIRESAFTFIAFMDFSSYAARKNPWATIEMFRALLAARPFDDIQLVLKMKGDKQAADKLLEEIDLPPDAFIVINQRLTTFEQHSLIAACDCLVSLHRAEGFGRGPGEAMRLGRGVLATGWSGNLDFMNDETSMLVDFQLVPVAQDEYPESDGQCWAEPDVDHAISHARWAIDNPAEFRDMAQKGFAHVIMKMGNRPVGLRMLGRIKTIGKHQ